MHLAETSHLGRRVGKLSHEVQTSEAFLRMLA
jgi:hypothetical protein